MIGSEPASSTDEFEKPYHPKFRGESRPGYWNNLTDQEMEALSQLRERAEAANLPLDHWCLKPGETINTMLLRFLRARKFDVSKAFELLDKDLKWRQQMDLKVLVTKTPEEILETSLEGTESFYPQHWMHGVDKQGRPVAYHHYGKFKASECLKITTLEKMLLHHIWCNEKTLALCAQQSEALGYNIETTCGVIDLEGWHLGLITKSSSKLMQMIAETDSDHYPERLGIVFVINCPPTLVVAWKIMSVWLDARTKEKIHFLAGKKEYLPTLLKYIDEDQIPAIYGGKPKPVKPIPTEPVSSATKHVSSCSLPRTDSLSTGTGGLALVTDSPRISEHQHYPAQHSSGIREPNSPKNISYGYGGVEFQQAQPGDQWPDERKHNDIPKVRRRSLSSGSSALFHSRKTSHGVKTSLETWLESRTLHFHPVKFSKSVGDTSPVHGKLSKAFGRKWLPHKKHQKDGQRSRKSSLPCEFPTQQEALKRRSSFSDAGKIAGTQGSTSARSFCNEREKGTSLNAELNSEKLPTTYSPNDPLQKEQQQDFELYDESVEEQGSRVSNITEQDENRSREDTVPEVQPGPALICNHGCVLM